MLRFALAKWIPWPGIGMPWATLAANVLSCVVLAVAFVWLFREGQGHPAYKVLIMTGFCGGFSTFSTFGLELFRLVDSQQWGVALGYVAISIAAAMLIFWAIHRSLS